MTVIDVHHHVIPRFVIADAASNTGPFGLRLRQNRLMHPEGYSYPVPADFVDPEALSQSLQKLGIDEAVVSIAPTLFFYEKEGAGSDFARRANDALAELARKPPVFRALATLPLQNPPAAVAELERATSDLGLVGALIGTTGPHGTPLDNHLYEPLFAAAERLEVPLMIHPYEDVTHALLDDYYLSNSIGNPLSSAVAAARIICSGLLDRHPNLRLVLVHGGGCLPVLVGRLDRAHCVRAESRAGLEHPPSSYLGRFWIDTVTHSDEALALLVSMVGVDRLLLGTDLPFDMGDPVPLARLARLGLDSHLLGDTALRLMGGSGSSLRENSRFP